jgi:hypothetical protein
VCFIAVLVPEYQSYVNTCVLHTHNHTVLSSNLYAAGYNFAFSDGNNAFTTAIGKYNTRQQDICNSRILDSKQVYINFLEEAMQVNQTVSVRLLHSLHC